MQTTDNASIAEMTEAISARLHAQWEGWKNRDAASNNAIVADDFTSFWPDGSRHVGRPTAQQMAEQPISGYTLSEFRVVPVGVDTALVTYFADIKVPGNDVAFHMAVGGGLGWRGRVWGVWGFLGA